MRVIPKKFILAIILFFVGSFVLPFYAQALTISPVKIEINGNPGQTLQGELTLLNEEAETKTLYSSANNFEAKGDTGTPSFLPEMTGLATWIKTESSVTLKSKEKKKIPYTISIPKDSEPGGYFAAILWGSTPPGSTESGQVAIGGRLGVLILLKVNGAMDEGGGILDFSADKKLSSSLPLAFAYRFNNIGADRIVVKGDINIKNLFGFTTKTLPVNENEGSVLPGSARKFQEIWGENVSVDGFWSAVKAEWSDFHLGYYTAHLDLAWGDTKQTASSAYGFFIIPWQLLLVIFAVILVVWFGFKKYNRFIVSRATQ